MKRSGSFLGDACTVWPPWHYLLLFAALTLFFGCQRTYEVVRDKQDALDKQTSKPPVWSPPADGSVHLALGNPSNAGQNDKDNFLISGSGSVISYNQSRGTANWISWRTTYADLGPSLLRPRFQPDPRLPAGFTAITSFDFSGSGYDRGHLVPSADRFADKMLNEETFFMTNIVPQTPALNQYPWHKLELYIRSQVRRRDGFDAYQIAGVYGEKFKLKGKVVVPTNCWKVVILLPRGKTLQDIKENTKVIAVDMPNIDGIENEDWRKYRTTVRAIEERTGYDLLSAISRRLQDELETRFDKN
jgi:endonuclease G, mitochondrial